MQNAGQLCGRAEPPLRHLQRSQKSGRDDDGKVHADTSGENSRHVAAGMQGQRSPAGRGACGSCWAELEKSQKELPTGGAGGP